MEEMDLRRFDAADDTRRFDKGGVVGDEPCVSLHFLGAGSDAK